MIKVNDLILVYCKYWAVKVHTNNKPWLVCHNNVLKKTLTPFVITTHKGTSSLCQHAHILLVIHLTIVSVLSTSFQSFYLAVPYAALLSSSIVLV